MSLDDRTWKQDGPGSFLAPSGVTAVWDRQGIIWIKKGTRWTQDDRQYIRWRVLVEIYGPVTEYTGPRP